MQNLNFFLIIIFTFSSVADAPFPNYKELKQLARQRYLSIAEQELNRAFEEAELQNGELVVDHMPAEEIARQLEVGGYLNPDIWIRFPQEKLFFHEGIFQYPVLKNLNSSSYSSNLTLPLEYLKQALGESIPAVRLFALNYLRKNNLTELVPSILTGFLNEEEDFLIKKYGQLLRSDLYQDKVPKNIPSSFLVKVQNYWETSVDLDHKANALFFAVQYTQFRPEPEIPILITMMDNGYPLKFLVRMFSAYPLHHLEAFITPFQQGYGDKWELILEIFLHFPSSEPILKAMFHALENRQEAHFASFQNKIIAAWERVSGITFEGETAVYQHWMQNQFKH